MNEIAPERIDDVLLSMVEGVGSRSMLRLLEHFGSSTAVLDAVRSDLSRFEYSRPGTVDRLLSARDSYDPVGIVEICRHERIDIVSFRDDRYPEPLRAIHDPPPLLYVRGRILPQDTFSLAVIGTRRCTAYGKRQTERLTAALSKSGFTIVSGLARGIDAVAHRTALNVGGRTLAVLGSGHLRLYPPEHEDLARDIVQAGGAVLSEHPPLFPSASWTFPQRNRIVSGLSLGVLVVEAPVRSGAMISARMAGEQGREIFAVPGPIDSNASKGCHALIRDGAYLVDSVDDVLETLGPLHRPAMLPGFDEPLRHPNEITLNEIEQTVLGGIKPGKNTVDTLVEATGLERHQVVAALGVLEEKRIIRFTDTETVVRM